MKRWLGLGGKLMSDIPIHTMLYRTHQVWDATNREKTVVGLSTGQPKVLRYLLEHPKSLQKDIASNCDIEAATASLIISRMLKAGLIRDEKVANDKRASCISITPKGEKCYKDWVAYTDSLEAEMLKGFSDDEKDTFKFFLMRVYKNLTGKDME
jgi:DNA-binding MarR family transcriptional regulator